MATMSHVAERFSSSLRTIDVDAGVLVPLLEHRIMNTKLLAVIVTAILSGIIYALGLSPRYIGAMALPLLMVCFPGLFAQFSALGVRFSRRQSLPAEAMTFCGWALLLTVGSCGIVLRLLGYTT